MTSTHAELVGRLSRLSVTRRHDAYLDIDWDAPANRIDPEDPCWELGPEHPVGASAWYRDLPASRRRALGLHLAATTMRLGVDFEGVLKRGLVELALALPVEAPERRYAYHELIEEAQHSLMFMEFLRRARAASASPLPAPGLPRRLRALADVVVVTARLFPELFFVFVLGGEDPIDHVERQMLAADRELHPLLRRIMQIHVTEEARHLAFARSFLRERVPRLSRVRREAIAWLSPAILAVMSRLMLAPPRHLARAHGIPPELRGRDPRQRARVRASVGKVRELLGELGLLRAPLWRALRIA
jgi:hypothetical protein